MMFRSNSSECTPSPSHKSEKISRARSSMSSGPVYLSDFRLIALWFPPFNLILSHVLPDLSGVGSLHLSGVCAMSATSGDLCDSLLKRTSTRLALKDARVRAVAADQILAAKPHRAERPTAIDVVAIHVMHLRARSPRCSNVVAGCHLPSDVSPREAGDEET